MKKSEKNVNQQLILLFCFLLFFVSQPAKSAPMAGDYQLQRTAQTKYVDKYFEVDGNGDYKIHIFLGEQKIATADNEEDIAYPINDHLGSPTVITNQVGVVVETNDYESYGQLKNTNSSIDNDYKFTGQEYDEENSLQYYGARYLDNELGRFISIDPATLILHDGAELKKMTHTELQKILTDPQRLNSYSYALNNPVIMIDDDGEFVHIIIGVGVGAIGGLMGTYVSDVTANIQRDGFNASAFTSNLSSGQEYLARAGQGAVVGGAVAFFPAAAAPLVAGVTTGATSLGVDKITGEPIDYKGAVVEGGLSAISAGLVKTTPQVRGRLPNLGTQAFFMGKHTQQALMSEAVGIGVEYNAQIMSSAFDNHQSYETINNNTYSQWNSSSIYQSREDMYYQSTPSFSY